MEKLILSGGWSISFGKALSRDGRFRTSAIVSKVWNYAHVLKNAGVGYGDYVEQITYLLFLKLADEMTELGFDNPIPAEFQWFELSNRSGDDLEPSGTRWTIRKDRPEGGRGGAHQVHYRHTLENLGKQPGLVGIIFRKAQNKIADEMTWRNFVHSRCAQ